MVRAVMSQRGEGVVARARAELARPGTWKRLVTLALWSTRDRTRAEDLASEAIMTVLDPDGSRWDGTGSFLQFMSFLLRAVFKNWIRRRVQDEVPTEAEDLAEIAVDRRPLADDAIHLQRTWQMLVLLGGRLSTELAADDPLARRCLDLWKEGMSTKEQAAALGCTEERVLAAQTLIKRRAARIRAEYDAAERDRMLTLQRAAAPTRGPRP
jgi:DNA-directed RNA polymerase specialized sigma24 family protein